jgi:uridine phosphorylase
MAADAVLPGDPARALALAQELLVEPLMSNHARGLWGYTGKTPAGDSLTIQSTGIGAASGAVVLAELAGLGVERAVRIGTCRALEQSDRHSEPGDVLIAERVLALDGVSAGLSAGGAGESLEPDPLLTASLVASLVASGAGRRATIAGTDPLTPGGSASGSDLELEGVAAADLQVSALVAVGQRVGVAVGCVDLVVESADGQRSLDDDEVMAGSIQIGKVVQKALASKE